MPQRTPSPILGYRDLRVWKTSMDLVVQGYRITESFPKHEIYGLTAQLRRAAVSIPANIAEGHGRRHLGDYLHHLSISNGSLMEVETEVLIAKRLGYITDRDAYAILAMASDVGRMLAGLIAALKKRRSQ